MTLRHTTIVNAANRHRFVTEQAAFPYLRNRERQNARRGFHQTLRGLDEALRASTYGTGNAQTVALRIARIARRLEHYATQLKDLPTVAEMKAAAERRERLNQWLAAHTPETTATTTVTYQLAAE